MTDAKAVDRFEALSIRGKKSIVTNYGVYKDLVYPNLDVENYLVLYSDSGRGPSLQRLAVMIIAIFLSMFDNCKHLELERRFDCDIAYQYVIGTTRAEKQPFSSRNFEYFLKRLREYEEQTGTNLIQNTAIHITNIMAKEMGFNLDHQIDGDVLMVRMDSMMVDSYSERLPRTGILYECIQIALDTFAKLQGKACVPPELHHFYEKEDHNVVIYHNQGSLMEKMAKLIEEGNMVLELMSDDSWKGFKEYQNLARCLSDQSYTDEAGRFFPRENSEIDSESLQSPHDTHATARTKNRKTFVGDVVNFKEAYDKKGNSIIINGDIQRNVYSDTHFSLDELHGKKADGPVEQWTTDGAFFSHEVLKVAEEKGVILVPTALTAGKTNPLYGEFVLSEDGKSLISCPSKAEPSFQKYVEETRKIRAKFDKSSCNVCALRDECPCKKQVRANVVEVSVNLVIRGEFAASLTDEEHSEIARYRNGVEAIPSVMRRKYHLDKMMSFHPSTRRSMVFAAILCYNCQKYRSYCKKVQKPISVI